MKPAETDPAVALARHAADFAAEDVPERVTAAAADLLLDTVGCMYGGSGAEGVEELRTTMGCGPDGPSPGGPGAWGGGRTTLPAFRTDTVPRTAAFLNSVMAHARDYDDTHDTAVLHGCVTAVPAMMAAVQTLGRPVSGREFLAALAVALDLSNRLSLSMIRYLHVGLLPTTVFGTFGAACGVGRLLALDAERMAHALGFAYSQICGNRQALIEGSLAKRIQPAFAAAAAFDAALFARAGLTAARRIIAGDYGMPALYTAGQIDSDVLVDGLGERWETANISIKPYPSCRCSHPVIDAALELRTAGVGVREILSGEIRLPPTSMGQIGYPFRLRGNPTVDAQFSAQYTAALALTRGRPTLASFEAHTIRSDSEVLQLASRISAVEHARDTAGLTPVEIRLVLSNGRTAATTVDLPSGHPDNPLPRTALIAKLHDNLAYAADPPSPSRRARIRELLESVPEAPDMDALIRGL